MKPCPPPEERHARALDCLGAGLVIVIDDDPDILDAFSRLVELEGHRCLSFCSARTFLDSLRAIHASTGGPICVLCDVRMPDMNGLELQAQLREAGDIPIILMSGSSGVHEAVNGFRAGAVDFLIKPIDAEHLIGAIDSALALSLQQRLHERRRQEVAARLAVLSEREISVARLVGSGLTNLGIALELGISERTVKFHRQHIVEKLAISSTLDLVRLLEEHARG